MYLYLFWIYTIFLQHLLILLEILHYTIYFHIERLYISTICYLFTISYPKSFDVC